VAKQCAYIKKLKSTGSPVYLCFDRHRADSFLDNAGEFMQLLLTTLVGIDGVNWLWLAQDRV